MECFELRFLHHVRRIDPRPDARVEAQIDEIPQRLAVAGEQGIKSAVVASLDALEQAARLMRVRFYPIHVSLRSTTAQRCGNVTGKTNIFVRELAKSIAEK